MHTVHSIHLAKKNTCELVTETAQEVSALA